MATFFLRVTPIKRSEGRSVVACAAYRAGTHLRDERLGLTFDYRHKSKRSEIVVEGVMVPDHAADWMRDRAQLWNEIERLEKRRDARPAREILIALPHELTDQQRHDLLRAYLAEHVVARGMIADYAIHRPKEPRDPDNPDPVRDPDQRNVHAHVLVTTRAIVVENGEAHFGAKPQEWNEKAVIYAWRKGWADAVNGKFAELGSEIRIDHRSYSDRGIDREPEPTVGVIATNLARKGQDSERQRERDSAKIRNAERDRTIAPGNANSNLSDMSANAVAEDAARRLQAIRDKLMNAHDIDKDAKERLARLTDDQVQMRDQVERDAVEIDAVVKQQQRLIGILDKERADSDKMRRLAEHEDDQKKQAAGLMAGQMGTAPLNPERTITQVSDRFGRALQSAGYVNSRHYEGMSKATWIEGNLLKREQARLATQISEEQDSHKRQGLILRYEIQNYDYHAVVNHRLTQMSVALRGHNPDADITRAKAEAHTRAASERRELYTQHFSEQGRSQQQSTSAGRSTGSQSRDEARADPDRDKTKAWGGNYSAAKHSATKHTAAKSREGKDAGSEAGSKDRDSSDRDTTGR